MRVGDFLGQEKAMAGHCVFRVKIRLCKHALDAQTGKRSKCNGDFVWFQMLAREVPSMLRVSPHFGE
jgi:hypothetical protein